MLIITMTLIYILGQHSYKLIVIDFLNRLLNWSLRFRTISRGRARTRSWGRNRSGIRGRSGGEWFQILFFLFSITGIFPPLQRKLRHIIQSSLVCDVVKIYI
ncbi:hypothetical protein BB029_16765 [Pseudomonas sp. S3E12]|nr:hypothetical protein BB029_16765 [Pseudomonas sp. S3E12]